MKKTEAEKLEYYKHQFIRRWYLVAKNQARTRGQEWQLSWEEYYELWNTDDRWMRRGRGRNDLNLCRIDFDNPVWDLSNCQIITRHEMLILESRHNRRNK